MGHSDEGSYRRIWEAAFRDAAGCISAYLTPESYGLEAVHLAGLASLDESAFATEIGARLDLGRAAVFASLVSGVQKELTTAYRHEIFREQSIIRGKIHVPRWMTALARGDRQGIPVIRAERNLTTPENLLVSEVFRISLLVVQLWRALGGAEAAYAHVLGSELQVAESEAPWNELRSKPRPSLQELVDLVQSREKSGLLPRNSNIGIIARLFNTRHASPSAFEAVAGYLAMLVTQQPEFEDKLFELLCLGWLFEAFSASACSRTVDSTALKGAHQRPILTGQFSGLSLEVFFQRASGILPAGRWVDENTNEPLRGIPDITLRVSTEGETRLIFVDAKNRSVATESDVAYKLLGYKENFGLENFVAVGLYPCFKTEHRMRMLSHNGNRIILLHVPLLKGRATMRAAVRLFLHTIKKAQNPAVV